MSLATTINSPGKSFFQWLGTHELEAFLIVYGLWVFTPFLAPIFMHAGWTEALTRSATLLASDRDPVIQMHG